MKIKVIHIVAPVLALAVVLVWNARQSGATRELDAEKEALEKALAGGRTPDVTSGRRGAESSTATASRNAADSKAAGAPAGRINWHDLVRRLERMDEGAMLSGVREMVEIERRISAMGVGDLLAALDEIARSDLDEEQRARLEELLVEPLIELDPEQALRHFADRIGDDEDDVAWLLTDALSSWTEKDPAAAAAWLDERIAAGIFESKSLDGHNQSRIDFEAALVGELLGLDPNAAMQRVAAMPEDQRREVLEQITFDDLDERGMATYVEIVRGLVPADEREGSISYVVADLVDGSGFGEVDRFLGLVRATPQERAVAARQAAHTHLEEIAYERAVTRNEVEEMRAWVERQAPGTADKVTGEALGEAVQDGEEFDFAAASRLVMEYHERASNDDVLVGFLESFAARSNLKEAVELAARIRDPGRRQEILAELE